MRRKVLWGLEFQNLALFHDFSDHKQFYVSVIIIYMIHVLQNLLTLAQLEILLARLESWRLSLKAGDLAAMVDER